MLHFETQPNASWRSETRRIGRYHLAFGAHYHFAVFYTIELDIANQAAHNRVGAVFNGRHGFLCPAEGSKDTGGNFNGQALLIFWIGILDTLRVVAVWIRTRWRFRRVAGVLTPRKTRVVERSLLRRFRCSSLGPITAVAIIGGLFPANIASLLIL